MSDMEKRVHDAFDAVHVPAAVKANALAAIEARRSELARDASAPVARRDAAEARESHAPKERREHSARVSRAPRAKGRASGFRRIAVGIAAAACFVLALVGVGGYLVTTPTAYVGIDVNPSIELGINRFDHVVEAKAYNQDGQDVLDQAQVEGMPYADALDAIEDAMADQGYLAEDAVVEVNVVCDTDALYSEIESACLSCFGGSGGGAYCSRATSEERQNAASAGMGMGKYRVYAALSEAGVDISADEASSMTMRELYDLAAAEGVVVEGGCGACTGGSGSGCGQGRGASGSGNGAGNGNGNGSGSGAGNGNGSGSGNGNANGSGGSNSGNGANSDGGDSGSSTGASFGSNGGSGSGAGHGYGHGANSSAGQS